MKTKVKICCISSLVEAQLAINAGADCLGLVGNMPGGSGIIAHHQKSPYLHIDENRGVQKCFYFC